MSVKLRLSARTQEVLLLLTAGFLTVSFNGLFQEREAITWLLRLVSGQQIYLLLLQFIGQYQILSFLRDYAYRNMEKTSGKTSTSKDYTQSPVSIGRRSKIKGNKPK